MRFQCPFCSGLVTVDNSDMGTDVQCAHCSQAVPVPSSRIATGAVIADFIILEELGKGGMGTVYLSHQMSLDRPAALKVLNEKYANDSEFITGFIKEARAAAKLNHPHIVQAYAVGEDDGVFYFAMEMVDGRAMKQVMQENGIISIKKAVNIISEIVDALDYAWKEQKLIHRDIKPDNIMLTTKGRAKLADLGLARVEGDSEDADKDEVLGTPQYISPEHLTGAPMDIRSDIYSLGATFYQFVTGRFPFEGKTAVEIVKKHLEKPLIPPNRINPKVPEPVSKIIQKMMVKNIKGRYQDAENLIDDLRLVRRGKFSLKRGLRKTRKKTILKSGKKTSSSRSSMKKMTGTHSKVTTSSSHSTITGEISLKGKQKEKVKKQMVIAIALSLTMIVLVIAVAVIKLTSSSSAPEEKKVREKEKKKFVKVKPRKTEFQKKLESIQSFVSKNPDKPDEFIERFELFLAKYGAPKKESEKKLFNEMLLKFVELDEKRIADQNLRDKYRKQHQQAIEKRRREIEERKAEELARKRAEEKRKAGIAARNKAQDERKTEIEQNYRDFQNKIVDARYSILENLLKFMTRNKFKKAFAAIVSTDVEMPNIMEGNSEIDGPTEEFINWCKEQESEFKDLMDRHEKWKKKMLGAVKSVRKLWEKAYNSKKEFHTLKLDYRKSYSAINFVRNGVMRFKNGNSAKFSDLRKDQFEKYLKRVQNKLNIKNGIFLYNLFRKPNRKTLKNAPAEWKDETIELIILKYLQKNRNLASEFRKTFDSERVDSILNYLRSGR